MDCEHGGLNYKDLRTLGISPSRVLDFSVSVFPDPLPPGFPDVSEVETLTRYPDTHCYELRQKILKKSGFSSIDSLLATNGTSQAIFLIVSALLNRNDPVVIITPTYGQYEQASRLKTRNIYSAAMNFGHGKISFPIEETLSLIDTESPRLLWICSPNNPTGNVLTQEDFDILYRKSLQKGTILILDEAYRCFAPGNTRLIASGENLLILRSMTKDYGLPGLRLGYILGPASLITQLKAWQPEWSVNAPAQEAGVRCFSHQEYFTGKWKEIAERTESLRRDIEALGFTTYPTNTNFFLFQTGNPEALKAHLWQERILVRDCHSFGLEGFIRVGCHTEKNNSRLIDSLKEYRER